MRRCVGGFVRHRRMSAFGSPAILLIPVLSRSRAAPRFQSSYLCSKPGPAWFPAHLFQVQHIEIVHISEKDGAPQEAWHQVHPGHINFCYSTHIMESIDNSFEFISIILSQVFHVNLSQIFSLVSFISKRNHRSSSTMNGWTRCLEKAFQQWILPQVRFSICQMLIKLSPDRQT